MAARDVFISHSSGDAEVAREVRAILEGAGHSCWMAPDDITGNATWTEQILAAIEDSKVMVVLVSAAANKSPHVAREVNLALGRRRSVLPIRIEPVSPEGPLEYLLSLVQRIDAFPPPVAGHAERILRRLEATIQRPETTPIPQRDRGTDEMAAPMPPPKGPEGVAKAPARRRTKSKSAPAPADAAPPSPVSTPTVEPTPRRRTSSADIGPGSVVGGFSIESQLGEGGMATVYRARQQEPSRLVALKVIRADHAANDTYRRRFLEEKQTLAALEHPSIVPIYAAGDADGILYIAMRLVDGPDLQAKIKRQGRLSLRETVQVLEPIADAVDYAHAMGVVHRDLKPSNIILDRDGRPYLTDFGLGKRLELDTNVSLPGMAIGTLDYMAPEQFTGKADSKLAPAIDLYALGCVAFQALTGQAPFVRDTPDQLMYAHAHEPPPKVTAIRPEYPAVVDAIFGRVLAKDPTARYATAREFVADLERVAAAAATHVTSPVVVPQGGAVTTARRWVGRNTAIAVGGGLVALVAVVALGAGLVFGPAGSPTPSLVAVATTPPPTVAPPTARPPTPPPTAPRTPTPDPSAFPNAFEAQLLAAQPAGVVDRSQCTRFTLELPTALATIACPTTPGASWQAVYTLFADPQALDDGYAEFMSRFGIPRGQTSCFELVASNSDWWFEAAPTVVEGRLGCYPASEGSFSGVNYVWTYGDFRVMGRWLTNDYKEGLDYFSRWVSGART